jgi:hypothetical protein
MGDEKKPWQDIPIEIIIEEEKRRIEEEERKRPRLELPLYQPSTSSYHNPDDQEAEESEHMIIIKL